MRRSADLSICLAIAAVSLGTLCTAFVLQYGFGVAPCVLCTYQRVPFALAAGFGLFGAAMPLSPARRRTVVIIAGAIFAAGAALAFYHTGVEHGWWGGTAACTGEDLSRPMTLADIDAALSVKPAARCDDVAWTLFGFSLTEINLAASSALALLCFALAAERRLWHTRRFGPRG
jgi:disulfide bond formation protein DsbB